MAETQKEKEGRLRREAEAKAKARTGGDTSFVAVNTLPRKETATTATGMKETARTEPRSTTEKIGATLHEAKEDVKEALTPDRAETGRPGTIPPPARTTSTATSGTTREADWETIRHPGMEPCDEDPYGTRPVSELAKPSEVTDKADLAAVRMMEREKAGREQMDRERIMTTATTEAAAARAALASKETTLAEFEAERERMKAGAGEEMAPAGTQGQHWSGEPWAKNPKVGGKETAEAEAEAARGRMMTGPAVAGAAAMTPAEIEAERERRMKTGAVVGGAALAAGAAAKRISPEAGERTTRQGAAIDTERPVTGTVAPPTTTTPPRDTRTVDERTRRHAEDPSVHPDWETQPQINAPMDVGIPTAEGQADAARIRAGRRRSDEAEEPRLDRRGGDIETPLASGARVTKTTRDDRGTLEKMKDTAVGAKEDTKAKMRDIKEDVNRKI